MHRLCFIYKRIRGLRRLPCRLTGARAGVRPGFAAQPDTGGVSAGHDSGGEEISDIATFTDDSVCPTLWSRRFRLPCRYSYRHSPMNVGTDADVATCAGHVQQLGSESLLPNLMEVKG